MTFCRQFPKVKPNNSKYLCTSLEEEEKQLLIDQNALGSDIQTTQRPFWLPIHIYIYLPPEKDSDDFHVLYHHIFFKYLPSVGSSD